MSSSGVSYTFALMQGIDEFFLITVLISPPYTSKREWNDVNKYNTLDFPGNNAGPESLRLWEQHGPD